MVGAPLVSAGRMPVTQRRPAGAAGLSATWPEALRTALEATPVASVSTLASGLVPITHPMSVFQSLDGSTIDLATPLVYPAMAERARRDRHVGLLFESAPGAPGPRRPTVLVCGLAAVRDADLASNSARYVALSLRHTPGVWRGIPTPFIRRQRWHFVRIWIEVTPIRVLWWTEGWLDQAPRRWYAPAGTALRRSDPPPRGDPPPALRNRPMDWRRAAQRSLRSGRPPVLTVLDYDHSPLPLPTLAAAITPDGFAVHLPRGIPVEPRGAVCVTFQRRSDDLREWESRSFVGRVTARSADDTAQVFVDRALPSLDLVGSSLRRLLTLARRGRAIAPRLAPEAARRGQEVPEVEVPRRW